MNMNHQKNQNEKDVWKFPCIFFSVKFLIGHESNFEKRIKEEMIETVLGVLKMVSMTSILII